MTAEKVYFSYCLNGVSLLSNLSPIGRLGVAGNDRAETSCGYRVGKTFQNWSFAPNIGESSSPFRQQAFFSLSVAELFLEQVVSTLLT